MLQVVDLTKRFGGLVAVDKVSLSVAKGELRAIIGPNGSGKSTMLNVLSGVYRPDGGEIRLEGQSMAGQAPSFITKAGIARTFQNIRLFDGLNVLENVMVGRHCRLSSSVLQTLLGSKQVWTEEAQVREWAMGLLDLVGLAHRAKDSPGSLPYGQRRLLEIARALASDPKVLLLDEPAAGLSASEVDDLAARLRRFRQNGTTAVVVEHNMRFVMGLADQISVLSFGKKIADGTPDAVRKNDAVIEAYLGRRQRHAQHPPT